MLSVLSVLSVPAAAAAAAAAATAAAATAAAAAAAAESLTHACCECIKLSTNHPLPDAALAAPIRGQDLKICEIPHAPPLLPLPLPYLRNQILAI